MTPAALAVDAGQTTIRAALACDGRGPRSSVAPGVVLIKRRYEPLAGRWSLPGGTVEVGETLEQLYPDRLDELGARRPGAADAGLDQAAAAAPTVRDLASRLAGSSDLYADDGRSPYASVNFVTCHDGFTLRDLVSYDRKHNEANGDEGGGEDNNRSWDHGAEGPTDDPGAVVDHAGRVHGVTGLRIADASVMPRLPSGNTNAPSIMIGEKCAAMVLEDAVVRLQPDAFARSSPGRA